MHRTIEAIYEKGVFRPVSPVKIKDHARVHLVIEEAEEPSEILTLASGIYKGLSKKDIEDVESVALDRSRFSRD